MIGRQGLEKTYEDKLRGVKGVKFFQKDKFNRIIGSYKNGDYDTLPIPSKDLTLTIDLDLQQYGDSLMQNKRGSIVAIEPKTGDILALINSPSYDLSSLIDKNRSINYKKLENDSIGKPPVSYTHLTLPTNC